MCALPVKTLVHKKNDFKNEKAHKDEIRSGIEKGFNKVLHRAFYSSISFLPGELPFKCCTTYCAQKTSLI